jgi:hypothetical protein
LGITRSPKHHDDEYNPVYGIVETPSDEEEGVLFEQDEEVEEGMDDNASMASASDFEGNKDDLPYRMMFDKDICRAIFTLTSDGNAFKRVCGCLAKDCNRVGHSTLRTSINGQALTGT